jgi:hypothetical protein
VTKNRTLSKENIELGAKIVQGFQMAYRRLVEHEALLGRTLVISKKGKPVHVPAKKLLKDLKDRS